jgi:glycosyltransferase involved in cell wall biosynthesis
VGDYTQALIVELTKKNAGISLFYRTDWSIRMLLPYMREIRKSGAKVVNLQYPTEGYGYSIVPQLLCPLIKPIKSIVTLHEFTRKSVKGKLAIYLFFLFSDWIVFTTEPERHAACRVAPWIKKRSCVIPIGSNIPMQPTHIPEYDIVYFGLIRPAKGLEDFTSIVQKIGSRRRITIRMIGQIVPGYEDYASGILERLKFLGVEVILNRPANEVSTLLAHAKIALLPFPDGMSLRRGTALAAMGNGSLLVTRVPANRSNEFTGICLMAHDSTELCDLTTKALDNYEIYNTIRLSGQHLARSLSQESIASSYLHLIEHV